jgi:hypothetical protein
LARGDLDKALSKLGLHGGRLGDTLVALGLVDAVDVFRAIRDQGRDRVAALCTWKDGLASFYRGTQPTHVEFPLELDLSSAIMAGVILASEGDPRRALPADNARVVPGPRHAATSESKEIGRAPASLIAAARFAPERMTVEVMLERLTRSGDGPGPSAREVAAAITTAQLLGWVAFATQ